MTKAKTLSVIQFLKNFPDERSSCLFVERHMWGDKPVCPYCKDKDTLPREERKGHWCVTGRKYFTIRIGTIFENSRLSLQTWLLAIYFILTARKGVSSLQLSKELDITQKTAWFLSQRLRDVYGSNDHYELSSGIVEIDETYIGGKEKNKHIFKRTKGTQGRSTKNKAMIVGARQKDGKVTAKFAQRNTSVDLEAFINMNVDKSSQLSY